jgi:hypothetical protein
MKRTPLITIVFCITVVSFLIFTTDSFSEATVAKQDGEIKGLIFTFPDPLILSEPINLTVHSVLITVTGQEHIVITSSKQYNYDAKFAGTGEFGDFYINGNTPDNPDPDKNTPVPIKLVSGSLNEHFKIQADLPTPIDPNKIPVPDDVDLFFKSVLSIGNNTFRLDLKLKHGDVQFIK